VIRRDKKERPLSVTVVKKETMERSLCNDNEERNFASDTKNQKPPKKERDQLLRAVEN